MRNEHADFDQFSTLYHYEEKLNFMGARGSVFELAFMAIHGSVWS